MKMAPSTVMPTSTCSFFAVVGGLFHLVLLFKNGNKKLKSRENGFDCRSPFDGACGTHLIVVKEKYRGRHEILGRAGLAGMGLWSWHS